MSINMAREARRLPDECMDFLFDKDRRYMLCVVNLARRDYLRIDCIQRLRDRNGIAEAKRAQSSDEQNETYEAFADLKKALEVVLAWERGNRRLHVTRIRVPRGGRQDGPC